MIEYQHQHRRALRFDRKCIELTLLEPDVRMCGPSDGEHRLGHIHTDDLETVLRHQCRHSAWTAANVGDANTLCLLISSMKATSSARSIGPSVAELISVPTNSTYLGAALS